MQSFPILLFDGHCNLCNASVQFVIRHDKAAVFRFASLQSEAGQALLQKAGKRLEDLPDSVILYEQGRIYLESDAILRASWHLGGAWRMLSYFRILPLAFRNAIYRWVARNRYQWFGRKEECWLPTPELKARFLS